MLALMLHATILLLESPMHDLRLFHVHGNSMFNIPQIW